MRLLYFSDIGQEVGGAEKWLRFLIERIDKKSFNPIFVSFSSGSLADNLKKAGIEVNIINTNKRLISITRRQLLYNPIALLIFVIYCIPAIKNLISFINYKDIDIVHTNSLKAHLLGGIAAKLTNKLLIWHMHELVLGRISRKLLIFLAKILPDRMIVVCNKHREFFASHIHKDKLITIHNGIDVDLMNQNVDRQRIRQEFGLQDIPLVALVSRLVRTKGHIYFLKAARQVKISFPTAKFLIVGATQGSRRYKQKLLRLADDLGLAKDVIFTGFRKDIQNVMASLDILVVPSLDEAGSMVILEAMSTAKPVVVTRVGGNPDIIQEGQTGILIPPADVNSLASGIVCLLRNPKKAQEMGKEGQKRVRRYFGLDKSIKATEQVYLELLTA